MANYLKMATVQAILTLKERGWSNRRIGRELGIRRETVSRYVRLARASSKPAMNAPPGSEGPKPAMNAPPGSGDSKPATNAPPGLLVEYTGEDQELNGKLPGELEGGIIGDTILLWIPALF